MEQWMHDLNFHDNEVRHKPWGRCSYAKQMKTIKTLFSTFFQPSFYFLLFCMYSAEQKNFRFAGKTRAINYNYNEKIIKWSKLAGSILKLMRVVPILCFTYYECKLGLILGAATPAALPTGGQRIGLERLFSPSPGRFHLKKSCAIMLDGAIQTSIDMQILCLNTTPHYSCTGAFLLTRLDVFNSL